MFSLRKTTTCMLFFAFFIIFGYGKCLANPNNAKDFINAVKSGNLSTVKNMLDKNPQLANATGSYTRHLYGEDVVFVSPALHFAIIEGNAEMVKLLLARGADPEGANNYGTTPLQASMTYKHNEITMLLIEKGANVNARVQSGQAEGWTPLRMAAHNGDALIAELLIKKGADLNAPDKSGITPLHSAAYFGHVNVIKVLLDNKANVNIRDMDGNTPLKIAIIRNHHQAAELIRSRGGQE